MELRDFLVKLGISCVATALVLTLFHLILPQLAAFESFSWMCLTAFMVYSVVLFFFAQRAAYSTNKNIFTSIMVLSTMTKILFSVILILIYTKLAQPTGSWFLIPFFANYVIFTILEVWFMSKLGRIKPGEKKTK